MIATYKCDLQKGPKGRIYFMLALFSCFTVFGSACLSFCVSEYLSALSGLKRLTIISKICSFSHFQWKSLNT